MGSGLGSFGEILVVVAGEHVYELAFGAGGGRSRRSGREVDFDHLVRVHQTRWHLLALIVKNSIELLLLFDTLFLTLDRRFLFFLQYFTLKIPPSFFFLPLPPLPLHLLQLPLLPLQFLLNIQFQLSFQSFLLRHRMALHHSALDR